MSVVGEYLPSPPINIPMSLVWSTFLLFGAAWEGKFKTDLLKTSASFPFNLPEGEDSSL